MMLYMSNDIDKPQIIMQKVMWEKKHMMNNYWNKVLKCKLTNIDNNKIPKA